jgi:serine/threonine-protein kinase
MCVMAVPSNASFIEGVCASGLLSEVQLEELGRNLQPKFAEPMVLARELVKRSWLTALQANRLLTGRGASLRMGPFLLVDKLGQGTLGKSYRVRDLVRDKLLALKILHPDLVASPDAGRPLLRQITALAKIEHNNLARYYDTGREGAVHFIVMEAIDGIDLEQLVRQRGKQAVAQSCEWIRQAAQGLQFASDHQQLHRDVKPAHLVLTTKSGTIKLLDMGLAAWAEGLTDPRSQMYLERANARVTGYRAPECFDGPAGDQRSDLFSLGCTFYALLTGRVPYPGGQPTSEPPPIDQARKDVPPAVQAVLRRMMALNPEQRYARASEVVVDLAPFCGDGGGAVDFSLEGLHAPQASGITMALTRPASFFQLSATRLAATVPVPAINTPTPPPIRQFVPHPQPTVPPPRSVAAAAPGAAAGGLTRMRILLLALGAFLGAAGFAYLLTLFDQPAPATPPAPRPIEVYLGEQRLIQGQEHELPPGVHDLTLKRGDEKIGTYRVRVP